MDLVNYLIEIYGYDTPIFLKDIRIGRKSKTAVRAEFSRMVKTGKMNRDGRGVYSMVAPKGSFRGAVTFESIVEGKFIYSPNAMPLAKEFAVEGYYSGLSFLNKIGISEQVPAVLEITTSRTSAKKSIYRALGREAIIRKAKTEVNYQNYRILQFLDMFHFLTEREVRENKELIIDYAKKNKITKKVIDQYLPLYGVSTLKKISEGGIYESLL